MKRILLLIALCTVIFAGAQVPKTAVTPEVIYGRKIDSQLRGGAIDAFRQWVQAELDRGLSEIAVSVLADSPCWTSEGQPLPEGDRKIGNGMAAGKMIFLFDLDFPDKNRE